MTQRKKLLITGVSGLLGHHVYQAAEKEWEVIGTFLHRTTKLNNQYQIDLTNENSLVNLFNQTQPEAVIHCAAAANPNYCEDHADETFTINVRANEFLATLCRERDTPLVFTSTDLVFDGRSAPYTETDPPNPINIYGEQKALAEERIRHFHPQATICRMALMYGLHPTNDTSFAQLLNDLVNGKSVTLFTDEIRSNLSFTEAARALLIMLNHPGEIVHIGAELGMSRYDFGLITANVFGLNRNLILPAKQADVQMPAKRPADLTFNTEKQIIWQIQH
jgi:dTDP-4-dehydrorhamnose reductase